MVAISSPAWCECLLNLMPISVMYASKCMHSVLKIMFVFVCILCVGEKRVFVPYFLGILLTKPILLLFFILTFVEL